MKKKISITKTNQRDIELIKQVTNFSKPSLAVLLNRNIINEKDIRSFLNPSFTDIREPFCLNNMSKAVERIYKSLIINEKILIFGDYDVDGITSTALLVNFFEDMNTHVKYQIPHRLKDGYSLKPKDIEVLTDDDNISLIITVDCGSSSHDAVTCANKKGIDVIITDHHEISGNVPDAYALINPKSSECTSGLNHLAGVGVAFYLIIALRKYLRDQNYFLRNNIREPVLSSYCDLVAMGTVADIVPLTGENRVFTVNGLQKMTKRSRSGLKSLIDECNINKEDIESDDIGYRLAPRINAAGRMGDAGIAVKLLTTKNPSVSDQIAYSLNSYNNDRKQIETTIVEEIIGYLENNSEKLEQKSIVLAKSGWHQGVIGIVASKLKERYQKPVIIMTKINDIAKASARSIEGFNIHNALIECSDLLEYFGGHSMAAGLTIRTENIALFREKFEEAVHMSTSPELFIPEIKVDYNLKFNEITPDLLDELERFKPFGCLNPEPIFVSDNIHVSSSTMLKGVHRKMTLRQGPDKKGRAISAIQFNADPEESKRNSFDNIVYTLSWNKWKGNKTLQMMIIDMY